MSFKQFFPIPVFIAVLAVTLVMLAEPSPLVIPFFWPWIAFQAWAMYFLAGCTLKGGVKVLLGYAGGAVASMAIMYLTGLLAPCLTGLLEPSLALPVALSVVVFFVVIGVICGERVPWFDFVPAWFVGAGIFFGVMNIYQGFPEGATEWTRYGITGAHLMVSCAVGLVYGVVTVFLRVKYEGMLTSGQEALPDAEAPAAPAPADE